MFSRKANTVVVLAAGALAAGQPGVAAAASAAPNDGNINAAAKPNGEQAVAATAEASNTEANSWSVASFFGASEEVVAQKDAVERQDQSVNLRGSNTQKTNRHEKGARPEDSKSNSDESKGDSMHLGLYAGIAIFVAFIGVSLMFAKRVVSGKTVSGPKSAKQATKGAQITLNGCEMQMPEVGSNAHRASLSAGQLERSAEFRAATAAFSDYRFPSEFSMNNSRAAQNNAGDNHNDSVLRRKSSTLSQEDSAQQEVAAAGM